MKKRPKANAPVKNGIKRTIQVASNLKRCLYDVSSSKESKRRNSELISNGAINIDIPVATKRKGSTDCNLFKKNSFQIAINTPDEPKPSIATDTAK